MLCDLDRELHLGRLARHLRPVVKIDDPHARRFAYRRAGAGAVDLRDDFRAADIVRHHRRALMTDSRGPSSAAAMPRLAAAPDDLVERMAVALERAARTGRLDLDDAVAIETELVDLGFSALDAGRPDVVGPATARARARLRRGALIDDAASGVAFGTLILAWGAVYCLVCPPAHAAARGAPLLTDERLFGFFTFAPFAIAGLLLLAFCWRERGTAKVTGDEATAPDIADIEVRARAADRG